MGPCGGRGTGDEGRGAGGHVGTALRGDGRDSRFGETGEGGAPPLRIYRKSMRRADWAAAPTGRTGGDGLPRRFALRNDRGFCHSEECGLRKQQQIFGAGGHIGPPLRNVGAGTNGGIPLRQSGGASQGGALLPLPLGEVAERSEDGEGNARLEDPLSHLR